MSHPRLQLQEFRDFGAVLEAQYRASGHNNSQRLSYIALYRAIIEQSANEVSFDMAEVLEGILILLLEDIDHTYWLRSSTNSVAFKLAYDRLQLQRLAITPDQRLICLHKALQYINSKCTEEMMYKIGVYEDQTLNFVSKWANKSALVADVKAALERVYAHDTEKNEVINGLPNLSCLQKQAAVVFKNYKEERSWRLFGNSDNRKKQELLNDLCDGLCTKLFKARQEKGDDDTAISDDYHTRLGVMLLLIMDVQHESKFFNPNGGVLNKGSELLAKLKAILNPDLIDFNDKLRALEAVKKLIDDFRNSRDFKTHPLRSVWKKEGFDLTHCLQRYSEKSLQFDSEVRAEKGKPSAANRSASFAVSCVTQSALSAATPYVTVTIGGGIASAVGGPIGFAIYMLTITGLRQLLNSHLISTLEASLYGWLFESIGRTASKGVSNGISFLFRSEDPESLRILEELLPYEERVLFVKYVNTLLELPMVSDKDKASLRLRRGLGPNEFLPLPQQRLDQQIVRMYGPAQDPAVVAESYEEPLPTARFL